MTGILIKNLLIQNLSFRFFSTVNTSAPPLEKPTAVLPDIEWDFDLNDPENFTPSSCTKQFDVTAYKLEEAKWAKADAFAKQHEDNFRRNFDEIKKERQDDASTPIPTLRF